MKASLKTEVEIRDIAVFAELAVWEKRPDLQSLCVAAQDQVLDADAVDTVLPGLSPRARENLLRHLGYIQLVKRNGALTALGHRCASSGEAPAWEQGVYRLLVASHPLFDSHVLDFKRAPGDWRDRDFDNHEPLPSGVSAKRDRVFTSVFDKSKRFNVSKFEAARGQDPVCRIEGTTKGKLQWDIDLVSRDNEWTIEGQVSGDRDRCGKFRSAPESVKPAELVDVFAAWEPRWDGRMGRLAMAYDGKIGQGGREAFLRSRRYNNKPVKSFGSFDEVVVRDVPVGPATKDDARTWATAILVAQAEAEDKYIVPDTYQADWSNIIDDTPLEEWAGDAPDPVALSEVNGCSLADRMRWLLAAGAELEMEA